MPKRRFTESGWRNDPWFKGLCGAMLSCKTEKELANFLRDIGTLSEMQAWAERLEVAKQLSRGLSYRQVAEITGASTTTVTRVARFIENGEGGYRKYLKMQHNELQQEAEQQAEDAPEPQEDSQQYPHGIRKASALSKYLNK